MQSFNEVPEKYYSFLFHYYRAEVNRENAWRSRLDITTNWAIVATAAMVSFTFGNTGIPHFVLIVNFIIVWYFLHMEARRFRYYMAIKERTRLLEEYLLSPMLSGALTSDDGEWMEKLSKRLKKHVVTMTRLESLAWRMRRNYFLMFPLLFLAWVAKIYTAPNDITGVSEFLSHAEFLFLPGAFVFISFLSAVVFTMLIALYIPKRSQTDDIP